MGQSSNVSHPMKNNRISNIFQRLQMQYSCENSHMQKNISSQNTKVIRKINQNVRYNMAFDQMILSAKWRSAK